MEKILIKNGLIFDPFNGIEGEKKDLLIESGVFVEKFSNQKNIRELDANGKTVIPAATDIHTHVASQQINWARMLGSKNETFTRTWQGLPLHKIATDYIKNGYTFILEANVFPSLAKQTIFDFTQLPILDKGMLLNVSNLWALQLEFQRAKIGNIAVFLLDLLSKTRAYGFKVYNPFESESWNFKVLREDITSAGRLYNFSALDVYENITKANEYLSLPHSVHAHIEGYETEQAKKNLSLVLDKIISLEKNSNEKSNASKSRAQIFHLAHASSYNMDGDNSDLINLINSTDKIDLDLGFIGFNRINPFITSDRRFINYETKQHESKNSIPIIRSAIELEGDSFAILRTFNKNYKSHFTLWANAINLALKVKNKWQVQLSLNYPNYGDINDVPMIASWLMSNEARKKFLAELTPDILPKTFLEENEETLTFNEFVIISRASPAKSLGLGKIKGNLGVGADGDLNILNLNINETDVSKDYESLRSALENIEYVIKGGLIVKNQENCELSHQGKIFFTGGKLDKEDTSIVMKKKKEFYQKYYSIFYDSLKVSIDKKYLRKID